MSNDEQTNIYKLLGRTEAVLIVLQDYLKKEPKEFEIAKPILLKSIEDVLKELKDKR